MDTVANNSASQLGHFRMSRQIRENPHFDASAFVETAPGNRSGHYLSPKNGVAQRSNGDLNVTIK